MNKTRWILLTPLCVLLTSHAAYSEHHITTNLNSSEECNAHCTKSGLDFYDFFTSLSTDGLEKSVQNCDCIDKEKPAS
jgi:hypothetical protein